MVSQTDAKSVPDCLRWLFTPLGRQFFLSCDWSLQSGNIADIYTSQRDPGNKVLCTCVGVDDVFDFVFHPLKLFFFFSADPIAQLHRCFCRKLLERAVQTLIQPQSDSEVNVSKNDSG